MPNLLETIGSELTMRGTSDAAIISVASKSTWGGMIASAYGWFSQSDSAIFIGIVVTLLGFIMNYVFQKRKEKRDRAIWKQQFQANARAEERMEELHKARLEAVKRGLEMESCD